MKKRATTILLALVMALTLLPVTALAAYVILKKQSSLYKNAAGALSQWEGAPAACHAGLYRAACAQWLSTSRSKSTQSASVSSPACVMTVSSRSSAVFSMVRGIFHAPISR